MRRRRYTAFLKPANWAHLLRSELRVPGTVRALGTGHGAKRVFDGLGMLVEQAAESYSIWMGNTHQRSRCTTTEKRACLTYPAPIWNEASPGVGRRGREGAHGLNGPYRETAMTGSKRFISGAVCPACQVVDRIVIESSKAVKVPMGWTRRSSASLVACGFTEQLDADALAVSAPLPRARYDRSRRTTDQVEVVKILEPGPPKESS